MIRKGYASVFGAIADTLQEAVNLCLMAEVLRSATRPFLPCGKQVSSMSGPDVVDRLKSSRSPACWTFFKEA